jgi:alkanesulfonate monooxygenase SsuD/methylene tetrahydromethanopterin reductase-like flavin-dependent oxidoreductase (luciferase family)
VIGALRASDGAECFTFDGKVYQIPPTTIPPQARHKGDLTTGIRRSPEASARLAAENGLGQMFVAGAGLDEMTAQVRRFNTIRAEMGLPPDQPTTLL